MAGIEALVKWRTGLSYELDEIKETRSMYNPDTGVKIEYIPSQFLTHISQDDRSQLHALGAGQLFRISKEGKKRFIRAERLDKAQEKISLEIQYL